MLDEVSCRSGEYVYEEHTGQELLALYGYKSASEMMEDNDSLAGLAKLIDEDGEPLYPSTWDFVKGTAPMEMRDELIG